MSEISVPTIIRTKRRSIALEITHDAKLIVRAPLRTPSGFIEKILAQKQGWISKKQKQAAQRHLERPVKTFSEGETFFYLGKAYPLRVADSSEPLCLADGEFRLAKWCAGRARGVFIDWYKQQALREILSRAKLLALQAGSRYRSLELSEACRRWGSCSGTGRLRINWRLILAPPEVLDYVIAHEVAHLKEKNHSSNFWERVRILIPTYTSNRKWLRRNEHLLAF